MLRLYRNGVEVGNTPCPGMIAQQPALKVLGIGCQTDDTGTKPYPPSSVWNGRLDEIAIFNHVLNADQVWQLYAGSPTAVRPLAGGATAHKTQAGAESPTGEEGKAQAITEAKSGRSRSARLRKRGVCRYGLCWVS